MWGVNIWVYRGLNANPRWSQLSPLPNPADVSLQWYLGSPSRATVTLPLVGSLMEMALPFTPGMDGLYTRIVNARVLVSWAGTPVWLGWVAGYRLNQSYVVLDCVGFLERMRNVVWALPSQSLIPVKNLLKMVSAVCESEDILGLKPEIYVKEGLVCRLPASAVVSVSDIFYHLSSLFPDLLVGAGLDGDGRFALWVVSPPERLYAPPTGEETVEVSASGELYWRVSGGDPLIPNLLPPLVVEGVTPLTPVSGPLHPNLSFVLGSFGWEYTPGHWEFREPDLDGNVAAWVADTAPPNVEISTVPVPVPTGSILTGQAYVLFAPGEGTRRCVVAVYLLDGSGQVVSVPLSYLIHRGDAPSEMETYYVWVDPTLIYGNVVSAKMAFSEATRGVGVDLCDLSLLSLPPEWKIMVSGTVENVRLGPTHGMVRVSSIPPSLYLYGIVNGPSGYLSLGLSSFRSLPFVAPPVGGLRFYLYLSSWGWTPQGEVPLLKFHLYNAGGNLISSTDYTLTLIQNPVQWGEESIYVYTALVPPPPASAAAYSLEVGLWGLPNGVSKTVGWYVVGMFLAWEGETPVPPPMYPYGDEKAGGPYLGPPLAPSPLPPVPYSYRSVSLPVGSDREMNEVLSRRRVGPLYSVSLSFPLPPSLRVSPPLFRPHLYRWVWRGVPWVVSELEISGGVVTARLGEAAPPLWQVLSGE